MNDTAKLWAADPHKYGPGKIHLIDPDKPDRTYCGKITAAYPGKSVQAGKPNCQICCSAPIRRMEQKATIEAWENENEERKALEEFEWRKKYNDHLGSQKWRDIAHLVHQRANGICEGCGGDTSTQVHHMTYKNLGDEYLWELKAVCGVCHERLHWEQ